MMASITLFISWVSINKNLAIADKQYLLLCGLNSSVTRRLARKCSCFSCWLACNNCVASGMVAVCSFSTLHYNQVVWLIGCTMGPDDPFFIWNCILIMFEKADKLSRQYHCMHNIFSKFPHFAVSWFPFLLAVLHLRCHLCIFLCFTVQLNFNFNENN